MQLLRINGAYGFDCHCMNLMRINTTYGLLLHEFVRINTTYVLLLHTICEEKLTQLMDFRYMNW